MRFRTSTATATSVAWRPFVCECSVPPITRFQRPMSASTKARKLYPCFLPAHSATLCNQLQMPVSLRGRSLGRLARHCTRTRWHNHSRIGMAFGDLAIDAILVVRTVGGERGDGTVDLIKQGADLRAVIDIVGSQRRRDNPPSVGINTDVQFAPRPAPAHPVRLDQPLAGTT